MKIGIVTGVVWASGKVKELDACRLYVIQPHATSGKLPGTELVAADPLGLAGIGNRVLYVTSTDAAEVFDSGYAPVNASIVGLVEEAV